MKYHLVLKPSAEKELLALNEKDRKRILAAFTTLVLNPFRGKKLEGVYRGCYSLKVWPYRIIYMFLKPDTLIIIVKVGHRQGVYR